MLILNTPELQPFLTSPHPHLPSTAHQHMHQLGLVFVGQIQRQPDSNGNAAPAVAPGAVDWEAPLAAFAPTQPSHPKPSTVMPFSELGSLSGIPNPANAASADASGSGGAAATAAPQQVKAKSGVDAAAAQRVAALAKPALGLIDNSLAAGRRGEPRHGKAASTG